MEIFNKNGKPPKEVVKEGKVTVFASGELKEFVKGGLKIKDIEIEEKKGELIYSMRFKGGGEKYIDIINNILANFKSSTKLAEYLQKSNELDEYYKILNEYLQKSNELDEYYKILNRLADKFIIFLDDYEKEFVAKINLPLNASEIEKKVAISLLNTLRSILLEKQSS